MWTERWSQQLGASRFERAVSERWICGAFWVICSSPRDRVTFYISMLMWWASAPPGSLISWMSLPARGPSHKLDHSVFPLPFLLRTCSPGRRDSRLQSFGLSSMPQWDAGDTKDPFLYVFVCAFNTMVLLWCCQHHAPPVTGMNVYHRLYLY